MGHRASCVFLSHVKGVVFVGIHDCSLNPPERLCDVRAFDPLEPPSLLVLTWSVALGRCRSAILIETRGVFVR